MSVREKSKHTWKLKQRECSCTWNPKESDFHRMVRCCCGIRVTVFNLDSEDDQPSGQSVNGSLNVGRCKKQLSVPCDTLEKCICSASHALAFGSLLYGSFGPKTRYSAYDRVLLYLFPSSKCTTSRMNSPCHSPSFSMASSIQLITFRESGRRKVNAATDADHLESLREFVRPEKRRHSLQFVWFCVGSSCSFKVGRCNFWFLFYILSHQHH